jgi:hypothetical protein
MSKDGGASRAPHGIGEEHWRPLSGWRRHASPLSLIVFGVVVALGLTGTLGHERDWVASNRGTRLSVHAPEVIRSGEFFEMRIGVESDTRLDELAIGISQSLWEDITVNTLIPAATEEASANGEFRFTFAELPADTPFLLKFDLQINPDIVGGNEGTITLYDGDTQLTSVAIGITVLP